MRGTMLIFKPGKDVPEQVAFHRQARLEDLKDAIGGGYLEVVPWFKTIAINHVVMDCVAMCDEDGKRKGLATNDLANDAWYTSVVRLTGSRRALNDHLVGNVIVIFGDREFMEGL